MLTRAGRKQRKGGKKDAEWYGNGKKDGCICNLKKYGVTREEKQGTQLEARARRGRKEEGKEGRRIRKHKEGSN